MNPKLKEIIEKTAGATSGEFKYEVGQTAIADTGDYEPYATIFAGGLALAYLTDRLDGDMEANAYLLASPRDLLALATELDAEVERLREALQAERDLRLAEIKDHQQKQTTMFKRGVNAERAIRAVEDKVGTTCFCGSDRHIDRCWPCAIREALSTPSLTSEESSPWQPIATAPKDGSSILCFDPTEEGSTVILRWAEYRWQVEFWHSYEDLSLEWEPTHWMPLPSAPSLTGEGGKR